MGHAAARGAPPGGTREPLAVGFRVKSGFAVAVLLAGTRARPVAVARCRVDLSDPRIAGTRQPYHSGFGEAETDARKIAARVEVVERCARAAIDRLMTEGPSPAPTRAALVVGSVIDPADVANPHIRAHASEGRLFRTVLEGALRTRGVTCDVIVEKTLEAEACRRLGCRTSDVARKVSELGKQLGKPWRSEEKSAATAAWMALA